MEKYSESINDTFKIDIKLPPGFNKNESYSIVYILDSNIYYDLVISSAKLMEYGNEIEHCIYVGIGYPSDTEHLNKRNRDFLPTYEETFKNSGGAEEFQKFFKEVRSEIEKEYKVNKKYLVGDSFSGLYGLFELFTEDQFDGYVIGSPSIYWDNSSILEFYKKATFSNVRKIFISVGELEAIHEPEFAGMVKNMKKMSKLLKDKNQDVTSQIFENETHLSVIPATLSRGLRVMIGKKV